MQSTNLFQIKAALRDQAFIRSARVSCPIGNIVAIRRRKGQLLALIRGWGRWYPVESVNNAAQASLHEHTKSLAHHRIRSQRRAQSLPSVRIW